MNKMGKEILTWEKLESRVKRLSKKIPFHIKSIYGIPRGGLIPAVMLSHYTGLPLQNKVDDNTLVVDDICDSSKTLSPFLYDNRSCLTLYSKHEFDNLICECYIEDGVWIQFPWETNQSSKIDYLEK